MNLFVVIALSPDVDVSTVVGPFQSRSKAERASEQLEGMGYVTEVCPLWRLERVEDLTK